MPTIGWTVPLEGKTHTVELDHGWLLGRRIIRLDGQVVEYTATVRHALLDRGSSHPFRIGSRGCELRIESNWAGLFRYVLMVDGREWPPSTPIRILGVLAVKETYPPDLLLCPERTILP